MQNLSGKSIPLLISKLKTAIMTTQRARGGVEMWRRREEIKDELAARGPAAVDPLLDLLRTGSADAADHAADVIGRAGGAEAVVPLAQVLAAPYPPHTKRATAKALRGISTPEAALAVNIWESRVTATRDKLTRYVRDGETDPATLRAVNALAETRRVSAERVADAYLLATTDVALSMDAQSRLQALQLTPGECATLEQAANPTEP